MRAFFQLVNGLQAHPEDEQALNLLIDIYIGYIDSPGVERDLLIVLDAVPNGIDIYEMVHATLEKSNDQRRLKSLLQTRAREDLLNERPATVEQAPHLDGVSSHPPMDFKESHNRGARSYQDAERNPYPPGDAHHDNGGSWDSVPAQREETRSAAVLSVEAPSPAVRATPSRSTRPSESVDDTPAPIESARHEEHRLDDDEQCATTGVFSSIEQYLDEQDDGLAEQLASRSKRRMLVVGAVILVVILIVIFAIPKNHDTTDASGPSETQEHSLDSQEQPTIERPLSDPPP